MNLQDFITWAQAQGQVARYNGGFLGQCVSLIDQYMYRVLGIQEGAWGDAYAYGLDSNKNVLQYFDHVSDLQPGDIVVYPAGWSGSSVGHIVLYIGNNQVLEQNGRTPLKITVSTLPKGYSTILRKKGTNMPYIEQSVLDGLEAWKRTGQKLSFDPAYEAMGGKPGDPLTGSTDGITVVLDDFRKNKEQNIEAQKQIAALKAELAGKVDANPDNIVITRAGFNGLYDLIKSWFNKKG